MVSCYTVAKFPFTFIHLMSPYYTERRQSYSLIYTVDLHLQLLQQKLHVLMPHTSAHAHDEAVKTGTFKILYFNTCFTTVPQGATRLRTNLRW